MGGTAFQYGVSIASASGAKGSWVSLGAAVAQDTFGIRIFLGDGANSAQDNTHMIDIGADPAGGTGYGALIPNLFCMGPDSVGGVNFNHASWFFPLFIKAGTTLAARAQIKGVTTDSVKVGVRLYQKPSHPERWRTGMAVETLGADTGNTRGTVLTTGSPSSAFGNWTSLGNAANDAWWMQASMVGQGLSGNTGALYEFCNGETDTSKNRRAWGTNFSSGNQAGRIINLEFADALVDVKAGQAINCRFATQTNNTGTWSAAVHLMR